jgi:hypothetical protein
VVDEVELCPPELDEDEELDDEDELDEEEELDDELWP